MKRFNYTKQHWMVVVPLLMSLLSCGGAVVAPGAGLDARHYADLERQVFEQTNILRTRPQEYSDALARHRTQFRGKVYYEPGNPVGIMTTEGVAAVDEALAVLEQAWPLQAMAWSERLAEVARRHVEDTGAKGLTGHEASNGDGFDERMKDLSSDRSMLGYGENISYGAATGRGVVLQLFIDDGVASRGHRANLMNRTFNVSGVGCGYHRTYGTMCVAIYGHNASL